MKKIILMAALAALTLTARAQDYQVLRSGTQTVTGGTSNLQAVIKLKEAAQVSFQYSFKLTGAGTTGVLFSVDGSNDGQNWQSNITSWVRSGNGTTAVTGLTNFNFAATPFIRVLIHNTNAATATNWQFSAVTKQGI